MTQELDDAYDEAIMFDGRLTVFTVGQTFEGIWELTDSHQLHLDVIPGTITRTREDRDRLTSMVK